MLGQEVQVPTEKGWAPGIILADRWIHDEENVANAATQQEFFRTTAGKNINQANFEGDYSIVPEGHVLQVIAHLIRVAKNATAAANTRLTMADCVELFDQGYFDWRTQGATTDQDANYWVSGGMDFLPVYEPANLGAADAAFQGDGSMENCRRYHVEKYIPGGRSIKYFLYFPGGITLGTTRAVQPCFYGNEIQLRV